MNMMDGFTLGKGSCPPTISKLSIIKVHTNLQTLWWHGFVIVADVTKQFTFRQWIQSEKL